MSFLAPLAASLAAPLLGKIFHFKEGGMVKGGKIGKPQLAVVHTGERVLTPAQNKMYEKMVGKSPRAPKTSRRKKRGAK